MSKSNGTGSSRSTYRTTAGYSGRKNGDDVLKDVLGARFDRASASKSFRAYRDDPTNSHYQKCVRQYLPLVNMVLTQNLYWVPSGLYEDARSAAIERVLQIVRDKRDDPSCDDDLTGYICKCIRFAVYAELGALTENDEDEDIPPHMTPRFRFKNHKNVENELFLKKYKEQVRENVLGRIRFNGLWGEVCRDMVETVYKGKVIKPFFYEQNFGVKSGRFLRDYIRSLIRIELRELRNWHGSVVELEDYQWIQSQFGEREKRDEDFHSGQAY